VTDRWIDDDAELASLVDVLSSEPRYAIDTEFHRERTYYPRLALVQLAWPGGIALVDPLAVDPKLFTPLFESDTVAVLHAAQQDLDVLAHAVGTVPRRIYDTQIAANFTGYATPSLVVLVQGELQVTPAKGDRLTDWLRRPLSPNQREYAAADVRYLLELKDRLDAQLAERGRLDWVAEACEELRTRPTGHGAPEDAWTKLKDARTLRPRARAVAQAVAAWREREAQHSDVPVRQILPDLAILGIAQRQPATLEDLAQCRGIDERHRRGRIGNELLAVVQRSKDTPPPQLGSGGDELERGLRPALALISAWVSQVAKNAKIDTLMLATRSDLIALLSGDESARLRHGWRARLVIDDINRLLDGAAGLTFDGSGGLRLIDAAPAAVDPGQPGRAGAEAALAGDPSESGASR
jgi:ribonuclease D